MKANPIKEQTITFEAKHKDILDMISYELELLVEKMWKSLNEDIYIKLEALE